MLWYITDIPHFLAILIIYGNSQVTNLLSTLQQQYASVNTNIHQSSLPPVPPKTREKIIKGDFIDFTTLITKVMFSSGTEFSFTFQLPDSSGELSLRPSAKPKRITSFSYWMEAWNVYLAVCINHTPSRVPSLEAYQRIIASASLQHPLESWINYDIRFRTLAASDPTLR